MTDRLCSLLPVLLSLGGAKPNESGPNPQSQVASGSEVVVPRATPRDALTDFGDSKINSIHPPVTGVIDDDFDNDGVLDFHLGTGNVDYMNMMPHLMHASRHSEHFDDVPATGRFVYGTVMGSCLPTSTIH